ncbi:MAG: radical SAM protein [Candidatus Cloacimonadaceae bacterium]|jgi:7-carboxy-7-deazaguanine synthase|nr:radical SAM protein [Candidatus Cloacimonadota bacterium]MDX9948862.1 radical SAM protein [Candidatus Syntrophosphaera sp.]
MTAFSDSPTLDVCEIFYSLQGESSFAGLPCIFIRLSGCNLHCKWCDTQYAWEPGTPMGIPQILDQIRAYPTKLVEITGGEPLLQDGCPDLMRSLGAHGYTVLLETNGSIMLDEVPPQVIKIVDVKCPGSGHGDSFLIQNLTYLLPHDELKFVIADRSDYNFAQDFIRKNNLKSKQLIFSPVVSLLEPKILAQWMLEDGSGARLQLQLHKILSIA